MENGKEGQSKQASTTRVGSRQKVGKKGKKKKEVVAHFLALLLIYLLFIRRRLPISFLSLTSLNKNAHEYIDTLFLKRVTHTIH